MDLFLDTGDPRQVKQVIEWGYPIRGVTTNPSSVSDVIKSGYGNAYNILMDIKCEADKAGDDTIVSAQALGTHSYDASCLDPDIFRNEAEFLHYGGFMVTLPALEEGFGAAKLLKNSSARINFALIVSPHQADMAADYGGTYASLFIECYDRQKKGGGMELARNICHDYSNIGTGTRVLSSDIEEFKRIKEASEYGAHAVSVTFGLIERMHIKKGRPSEWLLKKLNHSQERDPDPIAPPGFDMEFFPDEMEKFERDLLDDKMAKYMKDAEEAGYSIIPPY